MNCLVRADSDRKQAEQMQRICMAMFVCIEMFEDMEQLIEQDLLSALDQIEDEENSSLDKEATALLSRLLENVEEFYELREKIKPLMEQDEMTETKLIDLFQTIIRSRMNAGRNGFVNAKLK